MKKVLLRTFCSISFIAVLLSAISSNANPTGVTLVFTGINDATLTTKAVKDATFRKEIRQESIQKVGYSKYVASSTIEKIQGTVSDALAPFSVTTSTTCPTGVATVTYSGAIQTFQVPAGVTSVKITTIGANGGKTLSNADNNGGKGAILKGTFSGLTPLETLYIIVGQKGGDESESTESGIAGGGGGSFVSRNSSAFTNVSDLLMAAGGGGAAGTGVINTTLFYDKNANITEDGNYGAGGVGGGSFGVGGAGGVGTSLSGAGAGFNSNGTTTSVYPLGGKKPGAPGLAAGGSGPGSMYGGEYGGYGGGGAGYQSSGGGGGYSGGAGGGGLNFGGGGGSYLSALATNPVKTKGTGNTDGTGNGLVIIEWTIPVPLATISGTTTVCQNTTSPAVTFTGNNGTAPYTFTYKINNGTSQTVTSVGNSATVSAPTGASGTFAYSLVSVVDASASPCPNTNVSGTATVTVNALPSASISGAATVCQNAPSPSLTFTGSNGTAPYTFVYTINGGSQQSVTSSSSSVTVSAPTNVAGSFIYSLVSVTGSGTPACTNSTVSGSAIVIVNPLPTVTVSPVTATITVGGNISLTAAGATTYSWSPATGLSATTGATVTASPITATTYNVIGTNTITGCINSAAATITVVPAAVVCPTGVATVTYTGAVQTFQVPAGVTSVKITTIGANGGKTLSNADNNGGKGAILKGTFSGLTPLETLYIIVGQKGGDESESTESGIAGGGGGSFVSRNSGSFSNLSDLLMAAGGGGAAGAGTINTPLFYDKNANITTDGNYGAGGVGGGSFGTGGNGGVGTAGAGAGAGFNSNGTTTSSYPLGGKKPGAPGLAAGGSGPGSMYGGEYGGYGGGGAGYLNSGGGGGYSGGAGAGGLNFGGGGGSYLSALATNPVKTKGTGNTDGTGNGIVIITWVVPSAVISATSNSPICEGGTINLNATSGYSSYSWSGPNSFSSTLQSPSITSAAATASGTYAVETTDANGCKNTASTVVTVSAAMILTSVKTDVNCFNGSTGAIDLTVTNGTAPYTYVWSNGALTQDITGLSANTYNVTVTDAANCTAFTSVVITQPSSAVHISGTPTDALCNGGSTGSITASGSGGTSPYQYSLNGGTFQASGSFGSLSAATYTIVVKDANGCTSSTTVTVGEPSAVHISGTPTDALCNGGSTGAISASGSGGTSPYQYSINGGTFHSSGSFGSLSAATYTIAVKDANGCTSSTTVTVSEPSPVQISGILNVCSGSTTTLTGSGTAAVSTPWVSSNTSIATVDNSGVVTGVTAGTTVITYTNSNGCSQTTTVTVIARTTPTFTQVAAICSGTSFSLPATSVNGYTGTWSPALNNTATTTYTFTPNAGQCATTATMTVTVNALPAPTVTVHNDCGISSLTASGYTGSLLWSTGATGQQIVSFTPGTFTVTQTLNGCTSAAGSGTVVPNTPPPAPTVTVTNNCDGTSILTASNYTGTLIWSTGETTPSITVNTSGSRVVQQTIAGCNSAAASGFADPKTAPVAPTISVVDNCDGTSTLSTNATGTLLWSNGASTSTITVSTPGTYTVATTVNGCTSAAGSGTASPKTTPAAPSVSVTNNCDGTSTLSTTATGTLLWSNNATTSSISVSLAGTYTVTQTVNGCTSVAGSGVAAPKTTPVAPTVTVHNDCGISSLTASGYTGSLLWSTGATGQQIVSFTPGTFTVTQTLNGCTSAAGSGTVVPNTPPPAPTVTVTNNCDGTSILTASNYTGTLIWSTGETTPSITVNTSGSRVVQQTIAGCNSAAASGFADPKTAPVAPTISVVDNCDGTSTVTASAYTGSLLWSTGATTSSITVNTAGTYTATQLFSGCTSAAGSGVAAPKTTPTATITSVGSTTICAGSSVTLTASTGSSFLWSTGATTQSISTGIEGSYTVTVTNASGCSASSAPVTVTVNAPTTPTFTQVAAICNGSSLSALPTSSNNNITGTWSPALNSTATTTYTFTPNADQCATTATMTITVNPLPVVSASQTNVSCFNGSDGSIDVSVLNGTAPYTYSWSNGSTTEDINSLTAGIYTVTVRDVFGCASSNSVTIIEPEQVTFSTTESNNLCYGDTRGVIIVTATGGTGSYTYSLNNGTPQASNEFNNLHAGTYAVNVTDANHCTATATVTITEPAAAIRISPSQVNVLCYGASTGSINSNVSGGTAPYAYSWSNGAQTADISGLAAGTYTVTVTDANHCVATATVTITEPAAAIRISPSQVNVLCYGASTGSINSNVSGGTAPYAYSWTGGAQTADISGLAAGTYTVTVTDANHCVATATVTITEPAAAIRISPSQVNVLCYGASTGSINSNVSGGTAPYAYSWSNGAQTADISGLAAGTYTVTVTDANHCVATATVTITEPAAAIRISPSQVNVLCYGASTGSINSNVSGGTAPYAYSWSNGAQTADIS
ncbi:MAG: SprB repeat-containing protein, partial [Bacteroidota bacterium]